MRGAAADQRLPEEEGHASDDLTDDEGHDGVDQRLGREYLASLGTVYQAGADHSRRDPQPMKSTPSTAMASWAMASPERLTDELPQMSCPEGPPVA